MAELQAEFRRAFTMNEIADAFPRSDLRFRIDARAAGRDPPLLGHRRHLGEDEPGAAHAEPPKMHKVKLARDAAGLRRIHVHRRDHDAVSHRHMADAERREHRRRRIVERHIEALRAHFAGEP